MKLLCDITYIHTWQDFVYLTAVIDCYSKKVVGWAIADHMHAELVKTDLRNAAATTQIQPGANWHSGRGDAYASASFRALVSNLDMHIFHGPHRGLLGH